jgi:hypothetical protein
LRRRPRKIRPERINWQKVGSFVAVILRIMAAVLAVYTASGGCGPV